MSLTKFTLVFIAFLCNGFILAENAEDSIFVFNRLKNESFINEEQIIKLDINTSYINEVKVYDVRAIYDANGIPFQFHCNIVLDTLRFEKRDYILLVSLKKSEYKKRQIQDLTKLLKTNKQIKRIGINDDYNLFTLSFYDSGTRKKINGNFTYNLMTKNSQGDTKLIHELDESYDQLYTIEELSKMNIANYTAVYSLTTTRPAPNKMGIKWVYLFSTSDLVLRSVYSNCNYFKSEKNHW